MSIEAMKQALNALDEATTYTGSPSWSPSMTDECIAAASALRTALSQQPATGEPVLFIHPDTFAMNNAHVGAWKPGHELTGYIPLYTHPAPSVRDAVVRDAKRYEWLRKADRWPCAFPDYFDPEPLAGSDLDAAIDAAMLAAK